MGEPRAVDEPSPTRSRGCWSKIRARGRIGPIVVKALPKLAPHTMVAWLLRRWQVEITFQATHRGGPAPVGGPRRCPRPPSRWTSSVGSSWPTPAAGPAPEPPFQDPAHIRRCPGPCPSHPLDRRSRPPPRTKNPAPGPGPALGVPLLHRLRPQPPLPASLQVVQSPAQKISHNEMLQVRQVGPILMTLSHSSKIRCSPCLSDFTHGCMLVEHQGESNAESPPV